MAEALHSATAMLIIASKGNHLLLVNMQNWVKSWDMIMNPSLCCMYKAQCIDGAMADMIDPATAQLLQMWLQSS